tara:strand:+ start:421 stop:534 length:114 start_codon:yes stop_codon:yes gene_type:complete
MYQETNEIDKMGKTEQLEVAVKVDALNSKGMSIPAYN